MTPLELLRGTYSVFSILPEAELGKLSKRSVTRRWKRGEVLFRKGDTCDGMHGILSGCIVAVMENENGETKSLGTYSPGGFIGSLGIYDGGVRHVTAVVHDPSSTLFLPRREVNAAVANWPALKDRIRWAVPRN